MGNPNLERPTPPPSPRQQPWLKRTAILTICFLASAWMLYTTTLSKLTGLTALSPQDKALKCTISNLHSDLSFLDSAKPISKDEFVQRRDNLARALAQNGVDAFVVEPGYTFQYYGNISQTDWEPWEPEERPFLMVIMPEQQTSDESGGKVIKGKMAFLAPHFEEGRVRMLGIPAAEEELDIVVWEEHWDPYKTLAESRLFAHLEAPPTLMADEEMRDYIVRGLDGAGMRTVGLSPEAELVRQTKTPAEVELLRAVNTGTVVAVRAMRPCLTPGLTEDQVTAILNDALLSVGFGLFFNIVLFEEHGALPHGGFVTGGLELTHESMVVIDVGAHYLGYSSDICRSFLIDPPKGKASAAAVEEESGKKLHAEKEKVWQIVLEAQTAAAEAMRPNGTAASVDIAARTVIEHAGYGYGFTHRLGHGIGIKAHESPYLNKWNTGVRLQAGMTFTNEPGIYLENRFGVRHEDIYLVKEDGEAELLTGRRARGVYDP